MPRQALGMEADGAPLRVGRLLAGGTPEFLVKHHSLRAKNRTSQHAWLSQHALHGRGRVAARSLASL